MLCVDTFASLLGKSRMGSRGKAGSAGLEEDLEQQLTLESEKLFGSNASSSCVGCDEISVDPNTPNEDDEVNPLELSRPAVVFHMEGTFDEDDGSCDDNSSSRNNHSRKSSDDGNDDDDDNNDDDGSGGKSGAAHNKTNSSNSSDANGAREQAGDNEPTPSHRQNSQGPRDHDSCNTGDHGADNDSANAQAEEVGSGQRQASEQAANGHAQPHSGREPSRDGASEQDATRHGSSTPDVLSHDAVSAGSKQRSRTSSTSSTESERAHKLALLEEAAWVEQDKHIIVLSDAGKPIFTRFVRVLAVVVFLVAYCSAFLLHAL